MLHLKRITENNYYWHGIFKAASNVIQFDNFLFIFQYFGFLRFSTIFLVCPRWFTELSVNDLTDLLQIEVIMSVYKYIHNFASKLFKFKFEKDCLKSQKPSVASFN